jgi:hypothetical protein
VRLTRQSQLQEHSGGKPFSRTPSAQKEDKKKKREFCQSAAADTKSASNASQQPLSGRELQIPNIQIPHIIPSVAKNVWQIAIERPKQQNLYGALSETAFHISVSWSLLLSRGAPLLSFLLPVGVT